MTIASFCRPVRDAWIGANERCFQRFPCLADPVRRSSWVLKLALVALHLIFVYWNVSGIICCSFVSVFLDVQFVTRAALSKNESFNPPADVYQYSREIPGMNTASWVKRVMDLYPLGSSSRWKDAIAILLLVVLGIGLIFLLLLLLFHSYLILTNQTTYELVRRRRITYLSIYDIEPLPTAEELEAMGRPYTCTDILTCRCC
ncbi:hypothetical protein ACLOJK_002309 [Asimina triloba]